MFKTLKIVTVLDSYQNHRVLLSPLTIYMFMYSLFWKSLRKWKLLWPNVYQEKLELRHCKANSAFELVLFWIILSKEARNIECNELILNFFLVLELYMKRSLFRPCTWIYLNFCKDLGMIYLLTACKFFWVTLWVILLYYMRVVFY